MRRLVLTVEEIISSVEETMRPYLGAAAYVADHMSLVIAVMEEFCYSHEHDPIDDILEGYSLPTEIRRSIHQNVTTSLIGIITRGFGTIWPSRHYSFRISQGDVYIEERNYVDNRLRVEPEETSESITKGIEQGDHYPERMRRIAGV